MQHKIRPRKETNLWFHGIIIKGEGCVWELEVMLQQ